eukprot:gene15840-biopygen1166
MRYLRSKLHRRGLSHSFWNPRIQCGKVGPDDSLYSEEAWRHSWWSAYSNWTWESSRWCDRGNSWPQHSDKGIFLFSREGRCQYGCGSCSDQGHHIMECMARPCLGLLRDELGIVLRKWGMSNAIAGVLSRHPLVLRQLLMGHMPSLWLEHDPFIRNDKVRLLRLWNGVNVAFVRFLQRIRNCEIEKAYLAACNKWKCLNTLTRFLVARAPRGTLIPLHSDPPWIARNPMGLVPRDQPNDNSAAFLPARKWKYGERVEVTRVKSQEEGTWAQLTA